MNNWPKIYFSAAFFGVSALWFGFVVVFMLCFFDHSTHTYYELAFLYCSLGGILSACLMKAFNMINWPGFTGGILLFVACTVFLFRYIAAMAYSA